jgi:hypothetical protein
MSSNSKSARRVALRKSLTQNGLSGRKTDENGKKVGKNGPKGGATMRKDTRKNAWYQQRDINGILLIFAAREAAIRDAERAALKEERDAAKAAIKAEREAG